MTVLDYMVSAMALGLGDSFNPYMLSMVLGFLIFLAFIGNTTKRIVLAGKFVIAAAFGGTFFLSWGTNALWLERPIPNSIIRFLSLGMAVLLLAAGYVLFEQWRRGKANAATQWLPLFLTDPAQPEGKNAGIIFFSVMTGLATILIGSLWPPNQDIYIIHYTLFAGGNALLAALFFVLYSLSFVFFMCLTCWMVVRIKRSAKLRNDLISAISWVRISCSAFFIAAGTGLIFLFITL